MKKNLLSSLHFLIQLISIVVLLPVSPFFFIAWRSEKKVLTIFVTVGRLRIEFFRAFGLPCLTVADYYLLNKK